MIVVIDCNVLISAGASNGFVRHVLLRILEQCDVIVSAEIIEEYERVSDYPKFSDETRSYVKDTIDRVERCAHLVIPEPCGLQHPDPDDIHFIEAAVAGDADFIITGNLKHFPDGVYGNARAVSVREFAELAGMLP
jgi:putative PIN family toxin of toxin-antitoxin system